MPRLLLILALLAFALACPRAALVIAVVVATGSTLAVRWLLRHRTVFVPGRARWA
jgi:amino acid permease